MGEKVRRGVSYQVIVKSLGDPRTDDGRLDHGGSFYVHNLDPETMRIGFESTGPEPGEYVLIGHEGSVVGAVCKVTVRVPTVVVEIS